MLSKALGQGHNQNASTTLAAALGDSLILVTPLISSIWNWKEIFLEGVKTLLEPY